METRPTADEPAAGEPEGLEDLPVADEAAEHVTGGETAATPRPRTAANTSSSWAKQEDC